MEEMLIDPLSSYSGDETKYEISSYSDDETKCGFTYDEEDYSEFQEEIKRQREQFIKEIIDNWHRDYPHLKQAMKIPEGVSYAGNVSQTIIFGSVSPLFTYTEDGLRPQHVPDKYKAQLFAIDSSDGVLYQLPTHIFDYQFVDYAIQGNIVYFINSRWEYDHYINTKRNLPTPPLSIETCRWEYDHYMNPIRNLPTPPFQIETYNLITTKWNSQEDSVPLENVLEFESRLWPDGLPAYSISLPGEQCPWDYYFSGCVVDDIVFRCQAEDGKLFISVRSLDHIAEHDAKFVSYHRIDLNHCLTGFCNLHYPTCFLNHITGFKFCLVLFFAADFMLRYATTSVCILTVELAKGNENVRIQDDPDQSKARKGQMDVFKIESILNKSSFNLPNTGFPISCVKQENRESSKYQLFEIYDQNTEKRLF